MKNKICMGIWGMTNLRDRFNINGFGEEMSVLDRIKAVGKTEDVDGIELHVPTEIDEKNAKEIEKVLKDYNLQIVQLCGHTWTEKRYKFGALGDTDLKVRAAAVERVKWALDMGSRFNVPISVLWPATDGNDFPLQTDYVGLYDCYVDSVRQILDHLHKHKYKTKVCIEPKPFEPRSWIMMGTTAAALSIVQEVNDPNFGMNIDVGHSLIAKENVEDMFSLVLRARKLFHTHFDDNDQQADCDIPPGCANFIRLVSILYVLDQQNYDGGFAWHMTYPWPQRPPGLVDQAFDELAKRWLPILDYGRDKGVVLSYELHPGSDLFDGATYERFLEAVDGHPAACINYDPSHFLLQQLDYCQFIELHGDRIKSFHVKDAEFRPSGRVGVYGGYEPWAGRAGRFRSLGDGQVDFKRVFTLLTEAGFAGWAVLEWECCVKSPEQGAREGAPFIAQHIIEATEVAFDDFAGGKADIRTNKRILGLA